MYSFSSRSDIKVLGVPLWLSGLGIRGCHCSSLVIAVAQELPYAEGPAKTNKQTNKQTNKKIPLVQV